MQSILTITLNPAVDLATSVEHVVAGPKLYCRPPRVDPGGGGVNVARAIGMLGGAAKALVAVGGPTGERLLRLLEEEGVRPVVVRVSGDTRESFAVTDESNGEQFRFSVPGAVLSEDDADRLLDEIAAHAPQDGYVVLSGGVAPGLGDDYPARVQAAIAGHTRKLVVDTSKDALARLIRHPRDPVHVLRLNTAEARKVAGETLETVADFVAFGRTLINRNVSDMVVTGRASQGSVLVTKSGQYLCRTPEVPVVSKIGAGDAFTGAFTLALARGETPDLALKSGVAAASATMGTEGTGLCDPQVVKAILPECHVEVL